MSDSSSKTKKFNSPFLLVMAAALVMTGVLLYGRLKQVGNRQQLTAQPSPTPSVEVSAEKYQLTAEEKTTAFDLIKQHAELAYQWYGDDVFINAINGKEGSSSHYWAFYVNGDYAQQAANKTELEAGDQLDWVYEEIDKTQFNQ